MTLEMCIYFRGTAKLNCGIPATLAEVPSFGMLLFVDRELPKGECAHQTFALFSIRASWCHWPRWRWC